MKREVVLSEFILADAIAIALGTFFGGWRIIKTMAWLSIPVSTTHAITRDIIGRRYKKSIGCQEGCGKRIVYSWIITIPASAALVSIIIRLLA
jgi:inorganic phosphate transporter, PiT family